MQITYTAHAYKPSYESMEAVESGEARPYIFTFDCGNEYTKIGEATVTVTLFSKDELHKRELETLTEKLQEVRAENQKRENAILDRISKLQALTYVEAS